MSNEHNPILICNGNEYDLKNDGELICGGCGYVFDSNEAEELFKNVEFKPGYGGSGATVHSFPMHCKCCFQEFEKIYFSELRKTLCIMPLSKFKRRYITLYGELVLPKKDDYAVFIPSWDPLKRREMAYIDSIAYMLYSSNIKSGNLKLLIDRDGCALYDDGTIISGDLYIDIYHVSRYTFRHNAYQFDDLLDKMLDMENGNFFSMGVD